MGGGKALEVSQMVTRAAFDRLPGPGLRGNRGNCPPVKTPINVSEKWKRAGGGAFLLENGKTSQVPSDPKSKESSGLIQGAAHGYLPSSRSAA